MSRNMVIIPKKNWPAARAWCEERFKTFFADSGKVFRDKKQRVEAKRHDDASVMFTFSDEIVAVEFKLRFG